MSRETRVMARLNDKELKQLRIVSMEEDEGNISLTIRKALRIYFKNK